MLTAKQENYCQNILKGMTQYDAYMNAYNTENMQRSTVDRNAVFLARNNKILTRITELRALTTSDNVNGVKHKLNILTKIADETHKEPVKASDRIRAIAEHNKLAGDYPIESQVFQDNRVVNIIVSSEKAKELTENAGRRLLNGQDSEGEDEALP